MWYKLFSGAKWWLGVQCDLKSLRLGVSITVYKRAFWGNLAFGPILLEFGRD